MTVTTFTFHDTRTHACPGGCGRQVEYGKLSCRIDWYRLPHELRQRIWAAYKSDPVAHRDALAEASRWYQANPSPTRRPFTEDGGSTHEMLMSIGRRSGKAYLSAVLAALVEASEDAHLARCPGSVPFEDCRADWCTARRELLGGRIPT